ncbi:hypothetical protein ACJRO7_018147 [Eucalyptus globulus]|uniref:MATH domain-containing protein n=1 Tax=Eucalyptus globulus TaxID=34317 RepID=A0ABD3KSN4_EUCGL
MAMNCFASARESGKYKRALPPAHFSLKIESFEVLSKLDKYDSGVFKAGGHEWRLSLYPKGNKDDNGSGYISLYLSIEDRVNKMVYVNYKLFVHDKLRKEYLTIQDADEAISCFHGSKTQYGFPRFLSLKEFKKRSNGYLHENSCTFGAEVFVIEPDKVKEESFTLIRYPQQNTFTLTIENWSTLGTDPRFIEFDCEKRKWKLLVYPKGNEAGNGKSLAVYLEVQRLTEKMQVYADFNLRVLDQLKGKHKEEQFEGWLSASHPQVGKANFMPLKDLEKSKKRFVQNDTLVVEVQIRIVSGLGIAPSKPGPRVAPSKPGLGIAPLKPGLGIVPSKPGPRVAPSKPGPGVVPSQL